MKMKEFGPPGGGARPWRPPLDPPMPWTNDAVLMKCLLSSAVKWSGPFNGNRKTNAKKGANCEKVTMDVNGPGHDEE